jgi:positive regulator of sigma E activity
MIACGLGTLPKESFKNKLKEHKWDILALLPIYIFIVVSVSVVGTISLKDKIIVFLAFNLVLLGFWLYSKWLDFCYKMKHKGRKSYLG